MELCYPHHRARNPSRSTGLHANPPLPHRTPSISHGLASHPTGCPVYLPYPCKRRGRPARGASHDDHGGDRLRQLRRRGRDTALASSGEPGRAAHELSDRLTAKTERADASIRQDLYEAAWRRLQPLRCSSPRGRPRSSYSATEPTTRPGRSRRAAAGSLRRQVSTKGRERPAARARPTGP